MAYTYIEKRRRLSDPVVSAGDRIYCISSQNGIFPDPWGGHVPHEGHGVWSHPIKLLDGFWFALRPAGMEIAGWLMEADACRVYGGSTEFDYLVGPVHIVRRDFVPDGIEGMVVELMVTAAVESGSEFDILAAFRSDLRPAWLGDTVGLEDGADTAHYDAEEGYVVFRDELNGWAAVVGSTTAPRTTAIGTEAEAPAFQATFGRGASAQLMYRVALNEDAVGRLTLLIAGSSKSESAAIQSFKRLRQDHAALFEVKRASCQAIASGSTLISPDETLNEAFHWAKLNCHMLAREVPGLGRAAGAGLPTYPWWFGIDIAYSILPMLQAGLFNLAKESLHLLKQMSEKENASEPGRVIHELTTTGVVFNPGNLVETPVFTRAVHQCWLWTGDDAFLNAMYPFCKQGVLDYTLDHMDQDRDLCPAGRSVIETLEMHAGFECIDPAAYTWDALHRLADMARSVGDHEIVPDLLAMADGLGQRIREEWWMPEERLFGDVRASVAEVERRLHQIEQQVEHHPHPDQLRQAQAARRLFTDALVARDDGPHDVDVPWLLRHWVVMCPMEVGLATPEQAVQAFERLESNEFCGEWGMYLHPDRQSVMSINTGILALAEARYGRMGQALRLIDPLARSLPDHMPGAISEALPEQWCFMQLWSALGIISPVVECFLGVEPRASGRGLRIVANLPQGWDQATLGQVRIGDARFDIRVEHTLDHYVIQVEGDDPTYTVELGAYIPTGDNVTDVTLDGKPVAWAYEMSRAGRRLVSEVVHLGAGKRRWQARLSAAAGRQG